MAQNPATTGKSILLVEDQIAVAQILEQVIAESGGRMIGPVATIEDALDILSTTPIAAALLTFIVGGNNIGALADELHRRKVPFAITTGLAGPARRQFPDVPIIVKPFQRSYVLRIMRELLHNEGASKGR